jgi:hypothetical protein
MVEPLRCAMMVPAHAKSQSKNYVVVIFSGFSLY